jgi:Rrf2 family protein
MKTLSQKAKYALRALQMLAAEAGRGPVLISRMADERELPKKFLELILLQLKNHGLLMSKRGKGGGYQLGKPANEITLGQVVRIFDGPLAPLPCVSETAFRRCDDCEDFETCGTRLVMRDVRDSIAKVLDGTTVADLLTRVERAGKGRDTMYHI